MPTKLEDILSGSSDKRVQTSDLKTGSPLSPVARPVDTYFRPTTDPITPVPLTEFEDLARQLNIATHTTTGLLVEKAQELNSEEHKAGVAARIKNQKSFKDAVQAGEIKEAQNPWFVKGYMQQDGRVSALDFDAAMRTAWAGSPVKNSDDPQALSKFMADYRKQWISDHESKNKTQDWLDGFIPGLNASQANLSAQHVAHRQAEISRAVRENTANEIGTLLSNQQTLEDGMSPTDPIVQESRMATARHIQNLTKDLVKKGLSGSDANKITAEVVIAKGIELKDDGYARGILDEIKTPGGSVSKIADVAAKLNSAETLISNHKWQERMHSEHDEDRPFAVAQRDFGLKQIEHSKEEWAKGKISYDRGERVRALTNEMSMKVLAGQVIDPRDYQALAKDDASAAAWVQNFRHTKLVQDAEIITNQQAYAGMMLRMSDNPWNITARDIFGGVESKNWNMGVAMTMWNERQQMTGPGQDKANNDPNFTSLNHGLVSAITADVTNISGSAQLDASRASKQFRKAYAEIQANDKLTPSEKDAALDKKQLELMEHYNKIGLMKSKAAADAGMAKPSTIRGESKKPAGETPKKSDGPLPIPPSAVQYLLQHPETRADFEKKYNLTPAPAPAPTPAPAPAPAKPGNNPASADDPKYLHALTQEIISRDYPGVPAIQLLNDPDAVADIQRKLTELAGGILKPPKKKQ